MTDLSSAEVAETLALVRQLPIGDPPLDVENLPRRLDAGLRGAVAVVGQVSRGKSTLVNHLVGSDISPVAATPETVHSITVAAGAEGTWIWQNQTRTPTTGLDAEGLARKGALSPHSQIDIRLENTRLPDGIALVDTPGADEWSGDGLKPVAQLREQWGRTPAGAALLTVGYPPGPDSRDRLLYQALTESFPNGVAIVVKPTDGGFDQEDMEEVAAEVSRWAERPPIALPPTGPSGPWGSDLRWAPLEREIEHLARRSAHGFQRLESRYAQFLRECVDDLEETAGLLDPDTTSALASEFSSASPELLNKLRMIAADRSARIQRANQEAIWEAQVTALQAKLASHLDDASFNTRHQLSGRTSSAVEAQRVARQLLELAADGSLAARDHLLAHLAVPAARSVLRLSIEETIGPLGADAELTQVLLDRLSPSTDDTLRALRGCDAGHAKEALVSWFLRSLDESTPLRLLNDARPLLNGPARAELERVAERAHRSVATKKTASSATARSIEDALSTWRRWAEEHAEPTQSDRALREIAIDRARQYRRLQQSVADLVVPLFRRETVCRNPDEWDRRLLRAKNCLHELPKWTDPNSAEARQRDQLERLLINGEAKNWANETLTHYWATTKRAEARHIRQQNLYGLSFILWAVSVPLLAVDAGLAVTVWLFSLFMWLFTRYDRNVEEDFTSILARTPKSPVPTSYLALTNTLPSPRRTQHPVAPTHTHSPPPPLPKSNTGSSSLPPPPPSRSERDS